MEFYSQQEQFSMNGLDLFGPEKPQKWLELKDREGMNALHHTREAGLFQERILL